MDNESLCGYVRTVLTINHPGRDPTRSPLPLLHSHCHFSSTSGNFISQNGVVLSPIDENPQIESESESTNTTPSSSSSSKNKRWGRIGVVQGSLSVVRMLHALVSRNCISINAIVIAIDEPRVVVLVDVYLPTQVWSGWQFPRSRSTAAALFRHLSCDWKVRTSILKFTEEIQEDNTRIMNVSDCHVLGCTQHCSIPDPSKKKLFELHEIFKSIPSVIKKGENSSSKVNIADISKGYGISVLPDDVMINIFNYLTPIDLFKVSSTCKHLRSLASSIMPCMKLKLYPHQQSAVEWMLNRERDPQTLKHPLYMEFLSEDGFSLFINSVTGEIMTGVAPTVKDFRGGMFCDEPGLGKTITALSLILKTQGTLAEPPSGVHVTWGLHNGDQRCGYYELNPRDMNNVGVLSKSNDSRSKARRGQLLLSEITPKKSPETEKSPDTSRFMNRESLKRNLEHEYEDKSVAKTSKRRKKDTYEEETWIQCDACHKWRKLPEKNVAKTIKAWFCSMNVDPTCQNCNIPEESYDNTDFITEFRGFYTKGTPGEKEENVSFFINVLRENYTLINSDTRKALTWLAKLSPHKLLLMENSGLIHHFLKTVGPDVKSPIPYHKIFKAFGLVKSTEKGITKWFYPKNLVNLEFDLPALRIALCEPLDSFRIYLSKATLIVVPTNLVDHWKTQIQRHIKTGQLKVYIWVDHKRPPAHTLAWDYDIVITTFSRLSAEWGPRKRSELKQVHWLRVVLDEGHTLGSSVNLTNKLQMAVSLNSTNRWLLTGTPTPNTPNSHVSSFHPLLKFLHEEIYGQDQKTWELSVLRPFEAEKEEGRLRLLEILTKCMISARKEDLVNIPKCVKKVILLKFGDEHGKTYNELVETVKRNILLADWNDSSHVESLLNPKQWKLRNASIKNVRLSCCVNGHIRVTDAGQDIQETMDELVNKGLEDKSEEYVLIKYKLLHGGNCMRCNEWCRLPVITPCRHFLCVVCVGLDSEKCTFPGCNYLYKMQSPETLARPENPNPKWPVPQDLIELQPSYKQDDWNPDWQSTSSSKVTYLITKLKEIEEANNSLNFSFDTNMPNSCKIPPEKVIIFSQFLEHIHVIEQQLTIANIKFAGMYSPMHATNKIKSLASFQNDPECLALVMDGSAALGLDLSFVTRVYLMEPIWDKSMEEQVISRAHRMGATRPINVETLAMSGTIEEQMLKFLLDADECRKLLKAEYGGKNDREGGPRAYRTLHDFAENSYLCNLSFTQINSKG